jgi:hypothetical protein
MGRCVQARVLWERGGRWEPTLHGLEWWLMGRCVQACVLGGLCPSLTLRAVMEGERPVGTGPTRAGWLVFQAGSEVFGDSYGAVL